MGRAWLLVGLLAAGCGRLGFGPTTDAATVDGGVLLDGPIDGPGLGSRAPIQQVVGAQPLRTTPLEVTTAATGDGHTLIALVAVQTTSQQLAAVTDDSGANTWTRVLIGDFTAGQGRFEIWIATNVAPARQVTFQFPPNNERALAVNITEWRDLDSASPRSAGTLRITDAPATGLVSVVEPSLVIGVLAVGGPQLTPTLTTAHAPLTAFGSSTLTGAGAYGVVPAGDHEVRWLITEPREVTTGILALPLR